MEGLLSLGGRGGGTSSSPSNNNTILTPTSLSAAVTGASSSNSFLTEISSTSIRAPASIPASTPTQHRPSTTSTTHPTPQPTTISTTDEALHYLTHDPTHKTLALVLEYLTSSPPVLAILHTPSATSSQIVKALVDHTVPTFWAASRNDDSGVRGMIVECLRSVVGIGGIVAKIRSGGGIGGIGGGGGGKGGGAEIEEMVEVLGEVLARKTVVWDVWRGLLEEGSSGGGAGDTDTTDTTSSGVVEANRQLKSRAIKRETTWKELVGLVSGGKIVTAVAQAQQAIASQHDAEEERRREVEGRGREEVLPTTEEEEEEEGSTTGITTTKDDKKWWIADAAVYSRWLGTAIAVMGNKLFSSGKEIMAESEEAEEGWKCLRMVFWRSFGLGKVYWEGIVDTITTELILSPAQPRWDVLGKLLHPSSTHDKTRFINALLKVVSHKYLDPAPGHKLDWWTSDRENVGHIAALMAGVVTLENTFLDILVEWVSSASGAGEGIGIQRALLAALEAVNARELMRVLERNVKDFGDKLWIAHTPIQVQEANVQVILLCAGYVSRGSKEALGKVVRTAMYLNAISNRLSSVSARARFLGMVVGEAVSALTDGGELKLDFKIEEMGSEEALWWKGLVNVVDKASTVHGLRRFEGGVWKAAGGSQAQRRVIDISQVREGMDEDEMVVQVVGGDSSDGEDDGGGDVGQFRPYPKPDSDPEDEDDDPTMVNRNKEAPPVYIRDLLRLLRAHDSYDKQLLALTHAAMLIRRKAGFGTELADHLYELAVCLAGIQDKFDIEQFEEMRTQALIALVVAEPVRMGQWMVEGYFDGEYSIGQRAVLLTVVSMAARELAGFKDADLPLSEESGKGRQQDALFPSKHLPGKLHDLYSRHQPQPEDGRNQLPHTPSTSMRRIDLATASLEQQLLQPMALQAADTLSGPNILKIRTFSSRLAVQKRTAKPAANPLHAVLAPAFFYPLTARWYYKLREFAPSSAARAPAVFQPYLLSLYVKTLALLLYAAGPASAALPQMTREMWGLLLGLRGGLSEGKPVVVEATLFALLTLLELNLAGGEEGRRRVVEENSKALVETAEWVEGVFERSPGGGREGKVRQLAAAVLLRVRDVMEGYQRRLMGERVSME
ncbi:telomere length regulation protein-domain-containing protein [Peziza echinospora]|nr:telomere length regulation protein-domain-containing protein [Peziza echinospora]